MMFHLAILWSASLLAPRRRRKEWMAEWRSELWYVLQSCSRNREGLIFCLGAFRDAVWLRRNDCSPHRSQRIRLRSPLRCLWFLAASAAVAAAFFFRSAGPVDTFIRASRGHREFFLPHFLVIVIAWLVLPATTSLALGEFPAAAHSPARARRFRRWIFFGLKLGLILPIVFCGILDLAPILSASGLQPQALLIGYVLAFRWALIDQRRRCPVCLRLLTNPAGIGQPAQIFLECYGTELICIKGHGLMYVPEIATTYSSQCWLDLDASWSSLFS